ncbi:rhodanese-like domain-containing protein [Chloroflexota bacterium]
MSYKRLGGVLVIIGIMLVSGLVSCDTTPTPTESPGGEGTPSPSKAADAYVNSGKPLYITAKDLYDSIMAGVGIADYQITWYDPLTYSTAPLIIDVRGYEPEMPNPYTAGHIPGAVHIPWRQITQYVANIPKDRQIVVVSGTGQTGAAATSILNLMGYDAVNLMWGMASWTSDLEVAPGRYEKARDTVFDWGGSYRAVCPISEPTETYPLPVVENTESTDQAAIIAAATAAFLGDGSKRFDMTSQELYQALYYEQFPQTVVTLFQSLFFTGTATGSPYTVPFFLDIRSDETYENGHLCGTLHVLLKDMFKSENLMKLPLDRQILVYSDTGHEGAAISTILNLLGYDAVNLRWGITSWSLSLPGKDIAPERFDEDRDIMDYDFVTGFDPFVPQPDL